MRRIIGFGNLHSGKTRGIGRQWKVWCKKEAASTHQRSLEVCPWYCQTGTDLDEGTKDGPQQLSNHVEPPTAPGCVSRQAMSERDCRVDMASRYIRCGIDCSTVHIQESGPHA